MPPAAGCGCRAGRSRRSASTSTESSRPPGVDYELEGAGIVFARPIVKEKVTAGRWAAMYLGLFGTYRKHETVDVEYTLDGAVKLVSDAEILADSQVG